jgi:hypothetical protein
MYAGLDWSGTPFPKEKGVSQDFYVPCSVWMEDVDAVDAYFAAWRRELGRPVTFEFHAYRCSSDILLRAVEYVLTNGLVFAMVLDKEVLTADLGAQIFDHPKRLPPATARLVLDRVVEVKQLRRIWCDEDVASDLRAEFNTHLKRKARAHWPGSPDVKHYPSHKSSMIQLADLIAYVLQRDARGLSETVELRQKTHQLWQKPGNRIERGRGDDLRPYL